MEEDVGSMEFVLRKEKLLTLKKAEVIGEDIM